MGTRQLIGGCGIRGCFARQPRDRPQPIRCVTARAGPDPDNPPTPASAGHGRLWPAGPVPASVPRVPPCATFPISPRSPATPRGRIAQSTSVARCLPVLLADGRGWGVLRAEGYCGTTDCLRANAPLIETIAPGHPVGNHADAQVADAGAGRIGQQDDADRLGPDGPRWRLPVSDRGGKSRPPVLLMTLHPTQELEPPANPARFRKARLCDSLIGAIWSIVRSPPRTAESPLQLNGKASLGPKDRGTRVPRPVVCCSRCRSILH